MTQKKEEFIRTPTKASGDLTEEEKAKLKVHTDMWINRILKTGPTDFAKLEEAIKGLYRVSKLKEPIVVLAQSPLSMVFIYGAAAALIEKDSSNPMAAIRKVTDAFSALNVDSPTIAKQYSATAKSLGGPRAIEIAKNWSEYYQGGAYWAEYDVFLTAMRDVIGLDLPEYANYKFWEEAAIHGTFRMLHEEFCVVSDFPDVLMMDDQYRPHCQDGPTHRWSDGWELYHWHGVAVPSNWINDPKSLSASEALRWENIEQRRAACEIKGWASILKELKAKVINTDADPQIGELVEVNLPDIGKERFLRVLCGTQREFALPVPKEMKTAWEANAWTFGFDAKDFVKPEVRT